MKRKLDDAQHHQVPRSAREGAQEESRMTGCQRLLPHRHGNNNPWCTPHHHPQHPPHLDAYDSTASSASCLFPLSSHRTSPVSSTTSSSADNNGTAATASGESLLVQEMNALTVQERQEAYEDVHGVRDPLPETPDVLQQALQDFDKELTLMLRKGQRHHAFDKADILWPARTRDDAQWRLQFLRADDMNARSAAKRMLLYYQLVQEYFGLDATLRDLTWSDLTEQEMDFLRLGSMQPLLDATDRSGRPICAFFVSHGPFQEYRHVLRSCLVLYMHLLKDPVAQRLGFVGICYETGVRGTWNPSFSWKDIQDTIKFYNALPLKFSAIHYCYNDPNIRPFMEYVKLVIGKRGRVRFRPHFGSDTEVKYHLLGFGIDSSRLPVDYEGRMQANTFGKWLQEQQELEEEQQQQDIVTIIPTNRDVLLGKGSFFAQWPGNQRLSQMVADHWEAYQEMSRSAKTQLFGQVVVQHGGRFLKRSAKEAPWKVISNADARDKVAHSFRNKPVLEKYHATKRHPFAHHGSKSTRIE